MDRGELAFRMTLELVLFAALVPMLGVVGAFVLAHSFNFTFNGQLWVCARYCRFWRRSPASVERFLRDVAARLRELPWLEEAVCIGSRGAGTEVRHDRADIDLRLIVPNGASGWLRVNLLLIALRTRALLQLVPLDLYAYDGPESLARFRQDEPLLVILDRRGRIARRFAERQLVLLR